MEQREPFTYTKDGKPEFWIDADIENRVIKIGDWKLDRPLPFSYKEPYRKAAILSNILIENGKVPPSFGMPTAMKNRWTKEANMELTRVLGMRPSVFLNWFQKIYFKVFIADVLPYVNLMGRGFKGKINPRYLETIWDRKQVLDEVANDGLWNILPICFAMNAPPSECKKALGKGLWKRLCNNSKTRNVLISRYSVNIVSVPTRRTDIETLNKFSSSALKQGCVMGRIEESLRADSIARNSGLLTKRDEVLRIYHYISDMRRDVRVNPKWDVVRLVREHDRWAENQRIRQRNEMIRKQKDADKPFKFEYPVFSVFGEEGYYATPILTPVDLMEEGNAMNHCVGGYVNRVDSGRCIIYSIRDKDHERVSTLQISIGQDTGGSERLVSVGQHYGKRNDIIEDKSVNRLTSKVRDELVKENESLAANKNTHHDIYLNMRGMPVDGDEEVAF